MSGCGLWPGRMLLKLVACVLLYLCEPSVLPEWESESAAGGAGAGNLGQLGGPGASEQTSYQAHRTIRRLFLTDSYAQDDMPTLCCCCVLGGCSGCTLVIAGALHVGGRQAGH